jgi:hypothetical protein
MCKNYRKYGKIDTSPSFQKKENVVMENSVFCLQELQRDFQN